MRKLSQSDVIYAIVALNSNLRGRSGHSPYSNGTSSKFSIDESLGSRSA